MTDPAPTKLSSVEAAEIARRHGLGLNDAAALVELAGTAEEADQLAARFAPSASPAQLSRDDLTGLSPEQIEQARRSGQLDNLLGGAS